MKLQHPFPPSLAKFFSTMLTISLLFVSGQAVLLYGVLAGLLIIGAFLSAFLLIIPVLFLFNAKKLPDFSILNVLKLICFLESLTINFLIVFLIFSSIEADPLPLFFLAIFPFFLILFLFVKKKNEGIATVKMSLLVALAIFLPNYIFLQEGLETVYHNLLNYYPSTLHLEQNGAGKLFFLLIGTFFSKLLAQMPNLNEYVEGHFWKGVRKLFIGVFIWATNILAFSTMTLVTFTYIKPQASENMVFFIMLENQVGDIFVAAILLLICLCSVIEIFRSIQMLGENRSCWNFLWVLPALTMAVYFYFSKIEIIRIFILFGITMTIISVVYFVTFIIHHKFVQKAKFNINIISK